METICVLVGGATMIIGGALGIFYAAMVVLVGLDGGIAYSDDKEKIFARLNKLEFPVNLVEPIKTQRKKRNGK